MDCPRCGYQMSNTDLDCPRCIRMAKQISTQPPSINSPVKHGFLVFIIGCLVVGGLIVLYLNRMVDSVPVGNSSPQDAPSATTQPASSTSTYRTWQKIETFSGTGEKNTESFSVSDEWRIAWATKAGEYGPMNFQIYVYGSGGNLVDVAANVIGTNTDESIMHKAGTYYLSINSAQPYTIEVWDKR